MRMLVVLEGNLVVVEPRLETMLRHQDRSSFVRETQVTVLHFLS